MKIFKLNTRACFVEEKKTSKHVKLLIVQLSNSKLSHLIFSLIKKIDVFGCPDYLS